MSTSASVRRVEASSWRTLSVANLLALTLLVLPIGTAFAALVRTSTNIPCEDDYQAIARFIGSYADRSGLFHKLAWILTSQHNEYKLILLHAVVALQYELTGHVNYKVLQLLGDLAVPATAGLLWFFLARQHRPFRQAIWLFIAPYYLFFSICYWETLNFAMSEFATLAVIPIAVACILCYTSLRPRMELLGAVLLAAGIATLASGFFLSLALIPVLLYHRRYASALRVGLVTGVMLVLYRVHYVPAPPHPLHPAPHSTLLVYPIVFLGDIFTKISLCAMLGGILVAVFIALTLYGWPRRSPGTFTLALFCIVTALGVSAGRYTLGLETAMASRYAMYALLLVCAEYMALLEMFVPGEFSRSPLARTAVVLATLLSGAWMFHKQVGTYHILQSRQELLKTHLILWERHPDHLILLPDEPGYMYGEFWRPWRVSDQEILQREISAGRYIPPVTASDELPVRPHSQSTKGIEDEHAPLGIRF